MSAGSYLVIPKISSLNHDYANGSSLSTPAIKESKFIGEWLTWGEKSHRVLVDTKVFHSRPASYLLESLSTTKSTDRGGLSKVNISAKKYNGKRVRLSGYVKGSGIKSGYLWFWGYESENKYKEAYLSIKGETANQPLPTGSW